MITLKQALEILHGIPDEYLVKAEEVFQKEAQQRADAFERMLDKKEQGRSCGLTTWRYIKGNGYDLEASLNGDYGDCLGFIKPWHILFLVEKVLVDNYDGDYVKAYSELYK